MHINDRTYWAVYNHEQTLKVWRHGELVGEIPQSEFPNMILQMAKALKENVGNDEKS